MCDLKDILESILMPRAVMMETLLRRDSTNRYSQVVQVLVFLLRISAKTYQFISVVNGVSH